MNSWTSDRDSAWHGPVASWWESSHQMHASPLRGSGASAVAVVTLAFPI